MFRGPQQHPTFAFDVKYKPVTTLANADFTKGTYRIQSSGTYVLKEDILFEPTNDPKPEGGFRLGWFAAISVECDHVVLDLNGFRIEQGPGHYLRQRFFSIIELANSPFIPKQGPANFGDTFSSANYVEIKNGTLGQSSHHGIHGNDNSNVHVHDLIVEDFEIGGIALNGAQNVVIERLRVGPSKTDVPVNARFSQALFALPLCPDEELQGLVDAVLNGAEVPELFANPGKGSDGTVVGIQVHSKGVAIGPLQEYWDRGATKNVHLKDVYVCGLKSNVNELVGFALGTSRGNAYTPANVMTGAFGGMVTTEPSLLRTYFARAFRDKGVGNLTLEAANAILANEEVEAPKVFGLDAMGHTIKHTCGVFLSGIDHGSVQNVVVDDVLDTGAASVCGVVIATGKDVRIQGLEVSRMGKGSIGLKAVGDLANVSSEGMVCRTFGVPIVGKVEQKGYQPRVAQVQQKNK